MPIRHHLGCALITCAFAWPGVAAETALSDVLAGLGHPDTTACVIETGNGLGDLLTVQFATHRNIDADRRAAVDMLGLVAPALPTTLRWIAFEPARRWQKCRKRNPKLIFWRDADGNWRLAGRAPVDYLQSFLDSLGQEQRASTAEAYVLFSLGIVEQRLGRFDSSISHLERANAILEREDSDPHGIRAYILVPLIFHSASAGDEAAVSDYLFALAPLVGEVQEGYLPLIKRPPRYPVGALNRRETGYVVLEFTVDSEGRVKDPIIVEEHPTRLGFGAAAIEAAKEFRYIPKVVDGRFVSVTGVRNLITFDIE